MFTTARGSYVSSKAMRFEKLLEAVPDALVGMDQKGVIRFVNRQTELLFGYERAQLIGEPIDTLVPETLWQIYAQHREDYFVDPRTRSSGLDVELSGRHHNGGEFPINVNLSHIDTGDVLLVITGVGDMTAQQQAVKNAGLIEAIVEYSDDAIIGSTLQGTITSWNPAAEQMYGYSSREVIGRPLSSLLTPQDRAGETAAALAKISAGQHVHQLETERVRKDGTAFPVSITVAPVRDGDGAIVGASAIHRDVTGQRQAFEVAQALAAIVQSSDDAIIGCTLDGIVTSWNPAAERTFGYSSQEVIGKAGFPRVPQDRIEDATAVLEQLKAGQHVEHLQTVRVRKDDTTVPVSLTISPIRDADGVIIGASAIAHDVTEQKRASEAAQALAAIVQSSDDAIIGRTCGDVVTSWNPAAEAMFGYSSDEIVGESVHLVPEDRRAEADADAALSKVMAGQPVKRLETARIRKDGTVFPASVTLSPIRDGDGTITGVSAIYRDVTEQRWALEAAQRLAIIVENSDEAIISALFDGTVTSWNRAAEAMFGYSAMEIIGKSAKLLRPKDLTGEILDVLAQVRAGHHVESFETKRVRKDGTVVPVSLTLSPIRDADGAVASVSGTYRDITAQRQAFETAQWMSAIVQGSDDAIFGSTLEGTITSWNPAAMRLFGYSSDEVIGKSGRLLSPKGRTTEIKTILAKVGAGQHIEHVETIRVHKDGTMLPVSLTVSPIRDEKGTVVGASAINRNMTELKHAAQYARSLIETGLDSLMTISPDGKINDVNEATVRVTGIPRHHLIGTDFSYYFTEPDKALEYYERVFTQGSVTGYPLTVRHRDGTLNALAGRPSVARDVNGNVLGVLAAGRDVTEQKLAFEVAQRMAAIVQSTDDAIIGRTLEGVIPSWNPAAEAMFGYSSQEIIGQPIDRLAPLDRRDEDEPFAVKIRAGQAVEHLETTRVRKDGTVVPVSLTISPICDENDAVVGASVICHDMTEQKRTEQAVEQARAILRATMDSLLDPHVLLEAVGDEVGRIVDFAFADANPAACEYAQKTYDELTQMRLSDLFHGAAPPGNLVYQYRRVLETGEPLVLDDIVYTQELIGQDRHYDVRAARVGDRLSYTWRDVTDRHAAAEWLAESEEHFRLLAENASDVVMRLGPDRRFQWVSGSVADVLGWTANDLIGHVIDEFIHPDEPAVFGQTVTDTSPEEHFRLLAENASDVVMRLGPDRKC